MALEVVWTEKAKQNLFATLEYLEKEWSSRIASEFYTECIIKIELLKIFPYIGYKSKRKPSVRKILITKHNGLYYRVTKHTVYLLSVLDTRRDPNSNPYQ